MAMTKVEAVAEFKEWVLPGLKELHESDGGGVDWGARRESWNNFTDALCKDGRITSWQYENWVHPPCTNGG